MVEVIVEQISGYDVLQNAEGELLIAIRARMENAENPRVLYDGKKQAVFYRNSKQTIVLDQIPEKFSHALMQVPQVLFVEVQDETVIREYVAPVLSVPVIPRVG